MQPWSYSALNNFRTCPKKYWHYSIKKDIKEPENENMLWGNKVHAAMAQRIGKAKPLPGNMSQHEKWIEYAMANSDRTEVTTKVEFKMSLNEQFAPCEYYAKDVFLRTVADVLKLRLQDGLARIIDWKTGKVPSYGDKADEAQQQMGLCALSVFKYFPEVQWIRTQLIYLEHDDFDDADNRAETIYRTDLPFFWRGMIPIVTQFQAAFQTMDFPPKPSGLCKAHCAVTSCPYHGVGSR